ncbi:hypothetical protein Taro_029001 [Colocasia esculenta]|uniref:Uncharacterized protein n=1 Tax=Colocasia esculenta TaxID=4460 RepID=A0A843VK31_COLES|nr:hypothetical protein [Colocasia esculenta]
MSLQLAGVVWRSSWGLGSCGSTTRRTSSSLVSLLRPTQTVHLKSIKATCVNIRLFWTAIQEHVLSLPNSGADPVNAMAR